MIRLKSLPPANEVCEGYVFTGVCLSTGGGVRGRGHVWQGGVRGGGHACHSRYYGIRSMSGRYASNWNAFLLLIVVVLEWFRIIK